MIEILSCAYLVYVLNVFFGSGKDTSEKVFLNLLYTAIVLSMIIIIKMTVIIPF